MCDNAHVSSNIDVLLLYMHVCTCTYSLFLSIVFMHMNIKHCTF